MNRRVVLNTRPADQAAELTRLLRDAGFEVVEAPAIAVVPAWNAQQLERARAGLRAGAFDWLVLPSQNAGRDLVEHLRGAPTRVVCGTSTASALGLDCVAVSLPRFSAALALEALQPTLVAGQRVLMPRAAEGRDELVEGLLRLGAVVEAPIAYRTLPSTAAAERLGQGAVDVVTLCSPSAVRAVAASLADQRVVCLGETTAGAARAHGLHVDGIASQSSMTALVEAVLAAVGRVGVTA